MEISDEKWDKLTTTLATLVTGQALTNAAQAETNNHLARLNSKVATQEGTINSILIWKAQVKGFGMAINVGWTALIVIVSSVLSGIFIYWHK